MQALQSGQSDSFLTRHAVMSHESHRRPARQRPAMQPSTHVCCSLSATVSSDSALMHAAWVLQAKQAAEEQAASARAEAEAARAEAAQLQSSAQGAQGAETAVHRVVELMYFASVSPNATICASELKGMLPSIIVALCPEHHDTHGQIYPSMQLMDTLCLQQIDCVRACTTTGGCSAPSGALVCSAGLHGKPIAPADSCAVSV